MQDYIGDAHTIFRELRHLHGQNFDLSIRTRLVYIVFEHFNIRYSSVMGRISTSIAIFACLNMLVLQWSGLHLHADAAGQDAGLHVAHLHHAASEDHSHHGIAEAHDHGAETDISLVEQLGTSWTKLIPLLIVYVIAVLLGQGLYTRLRPAQTQSGKVRHLERWRPPLRAPPISL